VPRADLMEYLLSTRVLGWAIITCAVVAVAWLSIVVNTYGLAKPARLGRGKQLLGDAVVFLLCLVVAAPFVMVAYFAYSHRNLLNALFPTATGDGVVSHHAPPGDANAINKPRINVLLLGSDAGPDRVGTRTDSMVVASVDTRAGRTVLFGLPRNIAYAQFPPGSPMAQRFPDGFHDPRNPNSGDYLLNAVYGYGNDHPDVAPSGPSRNPGLNLVSSSISYMLGLHLDYYIQVNMEGFAALIDALGGLDVNVGPEPVPMGGLSASGAPVKPFGYIPPGRQHLNGEHALWFARSRAHSTDYVRMGRQRCLIQNLIDQKSPMDVLRNFQAVAAATTNSVSTNIPQQALPSLLALAEKARARPLESISFDPNLPDPGQPDGRFNTGRPDFAYMRQVVQAALAADPAANGASVPPSSRPAQPPPKANGAPTHTVPPPTSSAPESAAAAAKPTSLGEACADPSTS
jgi:polyisoprenyl-teichoic acid--peptidoglycan teichoic acid transferase